MPETRTSYRKVAVLGAGRSGLAAARLARLLGYGQIQIFDGGSHAGDVSGEFPLTLSATEEDGRAYGADLVILSPGIKSDIAWTQAFVSHGAELIGETEFACRHFNGVIIGITGTNGKTTTTGLVAHILTRAGLNARPCGNYGIPLSQVAFEGGAPYAALEVSSFQMETIRDFRPDVAVWLNFAPDHMDRYRTVEEYFRAKLRIFENMDGSQAAVVREGENLPGVRPRLLTFHSQNERGLLSYRAGWICEDGRRLIDLNGTPLASAHNAENAMAAALACRELGVDASLIADAVRSFVPPAHRCEIAAEMDGVLWLNDSKSTNLHSMAAALRAQTRPVILIAGGKDKGLDYAPILPLLREKAKACIVFGQIARQLFEAVSPVLPTRQVVTVEEAVMAAVAWASSGDVVLFSPGTSSFDQFTGYVQRGECFRSSVKRYLKSSTIHTSHGQ